MSLPPDLAKLRDEMRGHAVDYGLDFIEVIFELLDWNMINMVAAYGGFPNRYPHWRFGMEYERLAKSYAYGLSKIYEMVINNDPCYAYLLHSNHLVDQKMVMAHVYGHSDFFKNNVFFKNTNRKMMDEMGNHRTRVVRLMDSHGVDKIESFIDSCLSLENLIDSHFLLADRLSKESPSIAPEATRLKVSRPYMEKYINPPEFLESERQKVAEEVERNHHIPSHPEKDVMGFLLKHAPLENWEADLLSIVRDEAYYFAPQGQTKVINEGWASFWHSKTMTEKALKGEEFIEYADHHSGTVAIHQPGQLNPYKIGLELLRDIEDRWNKGRFGKEYNECTDMRAKKEWNKKLGLGREKIFEVRKLYNDVMFIDEFLTPEFCAEHKFFVYAFNVSADNYEIVTREFEKVKKQLLFQLTNMGHPIIHVVDTNYRNRGELMLKHTHEGVDLKIDWAKEVLKALHKIWKHPVHIETLLDGVPKILSFDGQEHQESRP